MKLNLGCGRDYRDGYINADISPDVGADISLNMEDGLPYKDNTFEDVLVNNSLTQVCHTDKFIFVMNELWRVTKPSGSISIRVPNAKDICAYQDPCDCRRFTDQTFTYMQENHRRYEQYGKHYGFKPFSVELIEDNGRQMIFNLTPIKHE